MIVEPDPARYVPPREPWEEHKEAERAFNT